MTPAGDTLFNRNRMLERLDGDLDLFADVLEVFLVECPQMLAGLKRAVESGAAGETEQAAHGLRGALLNVSADEVAHTAARLEGLARSGICIGADDLLSRLESELEQLKHELAAAED